MGNNSAFSFFVFEHNFYFHNSRDRPNRNHLAFTGAHQSRNLTFSISSLCLSDGSAPSESHRTTLMKRNSIEISLTKNLFFFFFLSAFDSYKSEFICHRNTYCDKILHFAFAGNVSNVTFQQQSASLRRHDWRTHSQRSVYVMHSEWLTATVAGPVCACCICVCVSVRWSM